MQVTNVTVGYDRKRQPAQYESAGASVSFSATSSATVSDNEDYVEVARKLLGEAKTLVLTELGLVPAGISASAHDRVTPAAEGPKAEGPKAETAAAKKKREAAEAAAAAPKGNDDIPDETPVVKTTAAATKGNDDIPDGSAPAAVAKDTAGAVSHADIQAYISTNITAKKISREQVKEITASFKKERIAEVAVGDLPAYKAKLDAIISPDDEL